MVADHKGAGDRIIVRRDGECVRLFSRKAIDWTARLPAIGASRSTARRSWSGRTGSRIVLPTNAQARNR
jgi:hypothetical protein